MRNIKPSTKHSYAAIEHRVIDSAAYADLTFAARALLVMIVRQLTKTNNGHLQATHSYLKRFGFSENTITRCIGELIVHGFIYRSRSGGFKQGAAKYAVTWLSITNKEGIFLQGFKPFAWRDWVPAEKKIPTPKFGVVQPQKWGMDNIHSRKNGGSSTPIFGDIEYVPCRAVVSGADVAAESWETVLKTQSAPKQPKKRTGKIWLCSSIPYPVPEPRQRLAA